MAGDLSFSPYHYRYVLVLIYMYVYIDVCRYVYMEVCRYVYMDVCRYVYMEVCRYVYMDVCRYVYMDVCRYVYLDVHLKFKVTPIVYLCKFTVTFDTFDFYRIGLIHPPHLPSPFLIPKPFPFCNP